MAQEYLTLEQAAQRLGVTKDQFLELADKNKLRRFAGPDTLRFWKHQVEEIGRQMGMGSDPELQPRDIAAKPASGESIHSLKPASGDSIFAFDLSTGEPSSNIFAATGKKPGSDSDVRLVGQGSDIELKAQDPGKLKVDSDSDVKLVGDDSAVPIGREPLAKPGSGSGVQLDPSSSKLLDSGVRLVEERPRHPGPTDSGFLTEELDLDAELRQAEKSAKPPSSKKKIAPFELAKEEAKSPSSSEFELTPGAKSQPSDSVFDSSSEQIKLDAEDDSSIHVSASREMALGEASGVNLHKPSDKGISLEKEPSSSEESLTLELPADKGKKPRKKTPAESDADSSSEFELSLEDDVGLAPLEEDKGSKEVYKTDLGKPAAKASDSSGEIALDSDEFAETSDFELALDEDSSSVEGETGSEVIVIDEDAGEAEATALRPDALEEDLGEVLEAPEEELAVEEAAEEGEFVGRRQLVAVEAPPAEWGIWGGVHILTVALLIPTGFLLFEMLKSIAGYGKEGPLTGKMFEIISGMMK
jgi:hypothetical protein